MLDRSIHPRGAAFAAAALIALGGAAAGCGSDDSGGGAAADGGGSSSALKPPTAPIKFDRGEFKLNPALAQKVKSGDPINVVLSVVG
jgi:hypothetical protein